MDYPDKPAIQLRFFRDLVAAERMKVFKVFGVLPVGAEDEVMNHYTERLLFDLIFMAIHLT